MNSYFLVFTSNITFTIASTLQDVSVIWLGVTINVINATK